MKQYPTIHLAQGATSAVELDLSEFDFGEGGIVALVVKDRMDNEFASWEFDTPQKHQILFTAEMTSMMELGSATYKYDVFHIINGEYFRQCTPSFVEVSPTVGGYRGQS